MGPRRTNRGFSWAVTCRKMNGGPFVGGTSTRIITYMYVLHIHTYINVTGDCDLFVLFPFLTSSPSFLLLPPPCHLIPFNLRFQCFKPLGSLTSNFPKLTNPARNADNRILKPLPSTSRIQSADTAPRSASTPSLKRQPLQVCGFRFNLAESKQTQHLCVWLRLSFFPRVSLSKSLYHSVCQSV